MEQFQYYAQNLNSLLNGYPVTWDKSCQVFNFFQSQLSIAQGNVKALLNVNNPEQGSLGCFSSPQRCVQISNSIQQQLRQLDIVRINSYMQGQMKYTYKILSGVYLSGDSVYAFVPNNILVPSNIVLNVDNYNFNATYVYYDHDAGWCTIKAPSLVWSNNRYEGTTYSYCQHYTGSNWNFYNRATSEYYFTLFRSQQKTQQQMQHQKKRGNILSQVFDENKILIDPEINST